MVIVGPEEATFASPGVAFQAGTIGRKPRVLARRDPRLEDENGDRSLKAAWLAKLLLRRSLRLPKVDAWYVI